MPGATDRARRPRPWRRPRRRACSILSLFSSRRLFSDLFPVPLGIQGSRLFSSLATGKAGLLAQTLGVETVATTSSSVMAGLDPAIHVLLLRQERRRGSPGQAR